MDNKESLSKAEGKFIKRKIDRLLKGFDELSRHQIQAKLSQIIKAVKANP